MFCLLELGKSRASGKFSSFLGKNTFLWTRKLKEKRGNVKIILKCRLSFKIIFIIKTFFERY